MTFTLPEYQSGDGIVNLLQYVSNQIPFFFDIVLLIIFLVISLGGYISQDRKTNTPDILMWLTIGAYITSFSAIILNFIPSVVSIYSTTFWIIITIGLSSWFVVSGSSRD